MSKPYELTQTVIDGKKIRGYESNNLMVPGEAIQEIFAVSGQADTKRIIDFDCSLVGISAKRLASSSGQMDVTIEITTPESFLIQEFSTGATGNYAFSGNNSGSVSIIPKDSIIEFKDYSSNPSLNKGLVMTGYLKRIKLIEL
jgi:hypothetical protein